MLHRPPSRLPLAVASMIGLALMSGSALGDTFYETMFLPTSSVVTLPTSSVVTTSYGLPTSYVVPTAYSSTLYPTSSVYASESVLVPTSTTYYRRSLFRPRRYVERTGYALEPTTYVSSSSLLPTTYVSTSSSLIPAAYYLPTTYIVPTSTFSTTLAPASYVIDNGVTMTSLPCETTSSPAPSRPAATRSTSGNGPSLLSEPTNPSTSTERKPSATLNSTPGGEGVSSDVSPPVSSNVATPPTPKAAGTTGSGSLDQPDLIDPSKFPTTQPGTGESPRDKVQIPPPGTSGVPKPGETSFRNVQRPAFDVRNILRGRVISAETKQPEEGVSVVVSSLTRSYADRVAMSDADGEFKVSLPDGDWTVKVKMPSGSIFAVGQDSVTASNGKVMNSSGRNIAEFLIRR